MDVKECVRVPDGQHALCSLESTSEVFGAGREALRRCAEDLDGMPIGIVVYAATQTTSGSRRGVTIVESVAGTAEHRTTLDRMGLVPGSEWVYEAPACGAAATLRRSREAVRPSDEQSFKRRPVLSALTPILDPRGNGAVGAVGAIADSSDLSPLLIAYARLIARAITEHLLGDTAGREVLLDRFVRARRRFRGPIVAVSERELLTNAAASRLVEDRDHAEIWEWTSSRLRADKPVPEQLHLRSGSVSVRCEPVVAGSEIIGGLLLLYEAIQRRPISPAGAVERRDSAWASLLPSELGVVTLVAAGLTNREIAARLFMSRHTVDSKLRRIFTKLMINSRIELTRLFAEQQMAVEGQ